VSNNRRLARIALTISTRVDAPASTLPTYRGAQIAIQQLQSRSDSPFDFELDVFDDDADTTKTAAMAEAIVADESFVGVVGPMGSNEAFVNAPIFDAAGLLQVSPCASHPDLCTAGYSTFFRLVPNETTQGYELARVARRFLDARTAAIVADTDAFGQTVAENFTAGFEQLGGEIVCRAFFERGSEEFGDLPSRVATAAPDLVFFAVHGFEGKQVSGLLRGAGVRVPFLGTDGMKTSFFLGGGDADGEAFHTHSGADFRRLESAAAFRAAYVAQYPEDSTYSPEAYDAVMLIAEAVTRAGSTDRDAVLRAFRELDGSAGVTGTLRFGPTGERLDAPVSLYKVVLREEGRYMEYLGTTTELCPA
jgi:branched-chain amino acid transport system substrate-binding protein